MKLAIVGSRRFQGDSEASDWAHRLIDWILTRYKDEIEIVISGGAIGIDELAIFAAKWHQMEYREFLPKTKNWDGYKARDMLIAEHCTHLVCITHSKSSSYGAGWTADYAEQIGKRVKRYTWKGQR